MRKIFSLILVAILIPCFALLSACGKNGGYQLSNLKTDLLNIAENHNTVIEKNGKFEFVYSGYLKDNVAYMDNILNDNNLPYKAIKDYNQLFNNLMTFVYENVDVCSNNEIEVDKDLRNSIQNQINQIDKAIDDVEYNFDILAEILKFNLGENLIDTNCLTAYKYLVESYSDLYQSAINLNNSLTNIYYTKALSDPNPNIFGLELDEFNSSMVISKFKSRIESQIVNLTNVYLEKFVLSKDWSDDIVENNASFGVVDLNVGDYSSNVQVLINTLNSVYANDVKIETAIEIANGNSHKQNFYDQAIKIYNLQETLDNDDEKFIIASASIEYLNCLEDDDKTVYETLAIQVVDDFETLINKYQVAMIELLELMGA